MGEEIGKGCGHAADFYDHALDPVAVDFPACVAFQVDVGFGDAVTPAPETIELPTIIDLPTPTLRANPAETVIAETAIAMRHGRTRTPEHTAEGRLRPAASVANPGLRGDESVPCTRGNLERTGVTMPDGPISGLT